MLRTEIVDYLSGSQTPVVDCSMRAMYQLACSCLRRRPPFLPAPPPNPTSEAADVASVDFVVQ